ncbi:MAG: hypothetical protein EAZ70_01550 [Runella slithyformis]|nr:MAG: hypothetical protein EAY79_01415 [Runella slithyformis]TAF29610.1 MAG: hypothetical protein EAZ70_01550 [Runella slithyformis]TAF48446.1 MAG: hypothetical protein EAZ63_05005 [Runella slithyformis]TAF82997.1 MAG: hypothetical protein EAZ50_02460 [Runella slithyformis]
MKSTIVSIALLFAFTTAFTQKKPLRRADSFLGVHLDFHAGLTDPPMGGSLTEGMIDSMLTAVKPDYIQIDCKGHPGVSSYPTKVGNSANNFAKDPLALFRKITAKHGVALYVHYSGVWDNEALKKHSNWAVTNADGKRSNSKTSAWSAYSDSLLIPQLKEIADYGVDGAWVDGDCWAAELDYNAAAVAEFVAQNKTATDAPRKKDDANYPAWVEMHRVAFRRYVNHYANALHAYKPTFQVASNWAFSSFMPEPVDANVDFISGDFTPSNSVHDGAFQARCIAPQGKPWDLMAWSFGGNFSTKWSPKSAIQLKQEAAQVLAMGGGFQAYFTQNRDASIEPWTVPVMAEYARFCRERQAFCFQTKPLPQVALLYSTVGWKAKSENIYQGDKLDALKATLNLLIYNQYPTEILMEHHLRGRMQQYPLIVIPEWEKLAEDFRQELLQYVQKGGNLLVIGTKTVPLFEKELGVKLGEIKKIDTHFGYGNVLTATNSDYQSFVPLPNTQTFGQIYTARDLRYGAGPAASVAALGKGKIAGIYLDFGNNYAKNESYISRDFLGELSKQLFEPVVKVAGSKLVQVAWNQKDGKQFINLINMGGNHKSAFAHDEIPPLGLLRVTFKTAQAPRSLTLQPDNKPINFVYKNGEVNFDLPKLEIHAIVVVEK